MIPGSANSLLLASTAGAAGGGYQIERSLRFNSADSAYLNRTPASAGNRKTWTWAGWVKRSKLGNYCRILYSVSGSSSFYFEFTPNSELSVYDFTSGYEWEIKTASVYRDVSAWYHIVLYVDTTLFGADRVRIYVNGTQSSYGTYSYPTQNKDTYWNNTGIHSIGATATTATFGVDSCLADIHFIDGQALDPTSFGEFDGNGIWQPKAYSGSYGTNGFHLPFSDNSTAAALGTDASPQGNTWAVNNISVAAGANNDSLVDSPTNYGTDAGAGAEVRGNYCTWGAVFPGASGLSNGNLEASVSASNAFGTISVTSGKWYWEVVGTSLNDPYIGIIDSTFSIANSTSWSSQARAYRWTGDKYDGASAGYGATWNNGDVIGFALDLDGDTLTFYKNGASQGVAFSSGLIGKEWKPFVYGNPGYFTANFGQRPFAYTAPSGFKALCTANLLSTTITTSGSYTGNGVADGPFVYLNGVPTAMTVNGNAVTFGTNADKLSNGFKIRTTSTTFNQSASTYNYSITSTGDPFKTARAQAN